MRRELKISIVSILALVAIISCIDNVTVINDLFKYTKYFFYLRYAFIFYLIVVIISRHKRPSSILILTILIFAIIILETYLNHGELSSALKSLSRPTLICLFIETYWQKKDKFFIVWVYVLYFLIVIDGISMILFPQGMFSSSLYDLNWFLGYKTGRYEYSMPLCILVGYLSYKKKNKYGAIFFITIIITGVELLYSQATGAFVSILFIGIICLLENVRRLFSSNEKTLYKIFNGKNVIIGYAVVTIAVFFIEQIPIVQYIVENIFNKDATLTTRTFIWAKCFGYIQTHPFMGGGYLSFKQFVLITGNEFAGSAHNLVLRIMVNAGIVGLILYVFIILNCFKSYDKSFKSQYVIFIVGIVSYLIIGISSDAMFPAFFGFALYQVLYLEINSSKGEKMKHVNIE